MSVGEGICDCCLGQRTTSSSAGSASACIGKVCSTPMSPPPSYRRYLERVWCRNPTALNRSRLTRQIHLCNRQMSKAKSAHYSKIIAEHSGDYGSLRKAFNKILGRCPKIHLPDHSSIATLANIFSSFLINKISVIRSSFPSDSHSRVLNPPDTKKALQHLSCVSADEVRHLVLRAPCKSSDLDPISTSLVKDCIDILITPFKHLLSTYRSLKVPSLHTLSLPTSPPFEKTLLQ